MRRCVLRKFMYIFILLYTFRKLHFLSNFRASQRGNCPDLASRLLSFSNRITEACALRWCAGTEGERRASIRAKTTPNASRNYQFDIPFPTPKEGLEHSIIGPKYTGRGERAWDLTPARRNILKIWTYFNEKDRLLCVRKCKSADFSLYDNAGLSSGLVRRFRPVSRAQSSNPRSDCGSNASAWYTESAEARYPTESCCCRNYR